MTLRVLVVGDPYMPVSAYASALAGLDGRVELTTMQIAEVTCAPPVTESERGLREYVGDPAEVARAVAGHDVLVVHGAAVSAEVLGAAPLRLVCCARGGPVNVDVAAATDRGIPVVNTPGKNAEAVAELTIAFALLLIRAVPRASRYLLDGGGFAESVFEGREFFGAEAPSLTMGLVGLGHVGREVARRARALGFAVLGYDPQPPALRDEGDVELVSLDTLLARSDIVLAARPADPAEPADVLPRPVRPDAARRVLHQHGARVAGGRAGPAPGAGTGHASAARRWTCWSGRRHRHPLLTMPNVFVTPHIGGATAETLTRGAQRAVTAVAELLAGRVPANVVNPPALQAQVIHGSAAG